MTAKKSKTNGIGKAQPQAQPQVDKPQPQVKPTADKPHGKQASGKAEAYKIWEAKKDELGAAAIATLLMKEAPSISESTSFAWQAHWRAGNRIPKAILAEKAAAKMRPRPKAKAKLKTTAASDPKSEAEK